MSAEDLAGLEEMGPVDYVVLEWPNGRPTGELAPMVIDLVERGLIRVLDVAFVEKDASGAVLALELEHLGDGALREFDGASSGLISEEDLAEAAAVLEPGSSAAVIIWENRWLGPLAVGMRRSGAQLVDFGRVPVQALLAAVDALEEATA